MLSDTTWEIVYENSEHLLEYFESECLLEAAFNMLKWCKENNYI